MSTPATLPADFFEKHPADIAPKTLPANFFEEKEELKPPDATKQAQGVIKGLPARIDAQSDILTNIRQGYKGGGVGSHLSEEGVIREGSGPAVKTMAEMGGAGAAAGLVGGSGVLAGLGRMLAAGAGGGAGNVASQAVTTGKVDTGEALRTAGGYAAGEGLGEVVGALGSKVDPLAKINKLLGVGSREVRVGSVPSSLDSFASNPARGVMNSGLDEKVLSKMTPLERNAAVSKARDAAAKKLDATLQQATQAGKTVDISKTITDTFKKITDPNVLNQATEKFRQILIKNNLLQKPLARLTPTEARAIQRDLDEFANFVPGEDAKSFRDVATSLRRGISASTRKAVPEIAEMDMHYGDLANAVKATQREANKFARTVPENKLRKIIMQGLKVGATGVGLGGAYELGKHFTSPVP